MAVQSNYDFVPSDNDNSSSEYFKLNLTFVEDEKQLSGILENKFSSNKTIFKIENIDDYKYAVEIMNDNNYVKLVDFQIMKSKNGIISSVGVVNDGLEYALNIIKNDSIKLVVYDKPANKLITYNLKKKFQIREFRMVRMFLPLISILRAHLGKK